MSELDRMIARLTMQRACLDHIAERIAALPGCVLEVGLGKARTFDHLRTLFPDRDLYAFDREVHAPAGLVPPDKSLFLGDFRESLPRATAELGRSAAFAHADIGSKNRARDAELAETIAPMLAQLVVPGGYIVTDRAMSVSTWSAEPLPGADSDWPYFMYRAT